jgi:hypothetical protein
MKNAPKRIFLQLGEDVDTKSTDWSEIHPECVSWCSERINANDLEYVAASENSQKVDLDHFVEWYETRFGFKLSEWGIAEYKKWEIPKQTD